MSDKSVNGNSQLPYEEMIEEPYERLIEECAWRKTICDVDVCVGECSPCTRIIESGKCEVLVNYFRAKRKEERK